MVWAHLASLVVLCAAGLACAGHRSASACAVESDASIGLPVYPACAVNRVARMQGSPPRLGYTPPAGQACVSAVIEFVVDSKGVPVPATAKIVRSNDMNLASAVIASLSQIRYSPAMKDGLPVAQRVRIEPKMVAVRAGSASQARTAARSTGRTC